MRSAWLGLTLTACSLVGGVDDDYRLRPSGGGGGGNGSGDGSGGAGGEGATGGGGSVPMLTECALAVGGRHACLVRQDATVWCWGRNQHAQIGTGAVSAAEPSPVEVAPAHGSAFSVALGASHSCAPNGDGSVMCWGLNDSGQLGNGTVTTPQLAPVAVETIGDAVHVSGGLANTCAIREDRSLWCWGRDDFGQLGQGMPGPPSPVPREVTALGKTVEAVAVGSEHVCALKTDGTVWCWGVNSSGQAGTGATTETILVPTQVAIPGDGVSHVAAGSHHTCVISGNDEVWCWGLNDDGQIGIGSLASPQPSPVEVTALRGVASALDGGPSHTCALLDDGSLRCWGANDFGQVGDGTTDPRPMPVPVLALGSEVADVEAGVQFTCARKVDGSVWCWGDNGSGQLGQGRTGTFVALPQVAGISCL